jgi:hypothetical protein
LFKNIIISYARIVRTASVILGPLGGGNSIPWPSFGVHNGVGFILSSKKEITANFQNILKMKNCQTYVGVISHLCLEPSGLTITEPCAFKNRAIRLMHNRVFIGH